MSRLFKVLILGIVLSGSSQIQSAGLARQCVKDGALYVAFAGAMYLGVDSYQSNPDSYQKLDDESVTKKLEKQYPGFTVRSHDESNGVYAHGSVLLVGKDIVPSLVQEDTTSRWYFWSLMKKKTAEDKIIENNKRAVQALVDVTKKQNADGYRHEQAAYVAAAGGVCFPVFYHFALSSINNAVDKETELLSKQIKPNASRTQRWAQRGLMLLKQAPRFTATVGAMVIFGGIESLIRSIHEEVTLHRYVDKK